jgi:hypothetical protein
VHLGDHDPLAAPCGERAERGRDRRLADPALAGDEEEPVIEERYSSPSQ